MKILARLFWVFTIFLLIAELIVFRQAISYHLTGITPIKLAAANQPVPVNHYISLPTSLRKTPPLDIKAPGYKIRVYQHLQNPEIFLYDLDGKLSAGLQETSKLPPVEGRLLQLKDAPFAAAVLSHFAAENNHPAYALLLNVKPRKTTFYLYLAAILLSILMVAVYPFLGKAASKRS